MKKTIITAVMLTIGFCTVTKSYTQNTQTTPSNFSSKLIGSGVVVADIEKSLDFYINGIGMVRTGRFTINADFSKRSGLANGDTAVVTTLKLENSPEANEWKLMSFGKKASHPKSKYIQDDTGVQYITINVKALKPIIERMQKMNVPLLGSTPTQLNRNSQFILVQDPDGTFIEIIGPME